MYSPLIRTIAGSAALLFVSACGAVSGAPGSALPATNPSAARAHRRLHAAGSPQSGTLFVADYGANDIAILSTNVSNADLGLSPRGTITAGVSGPRVLATDATGDLFVGNAGDSTIKEYANGSTTPALTIQRVYRPSGIAIDSHGNLWVSQLSAAKDLFPVVDEYAYDSGNKTFAKDPTKTIIGSGSSALVFPHGLAFDSSGNLFVADIGHSGALVEIKAGSTTPVLLSLPAVAQGSGGYPGFIVAPESVVVSGTGSKERLEVSDYAAATITDLSIGASKPAWQASSFFTSISWLAVDGNGFTYASAFYGNGTAPGYEFAVVDSNGNVDYQSVADFGIKVPEGLAFTTAGGSAAARTQMKRNR